MKARVPSNLRGFNSALLASSKASTSGPCGSMVLCSEIPPGTKPWGLASYWPYTSPMNSLMTFMWYQGGRNVFSATSQRSEKITVGRAGRLGGRGQHREDRRIGVVVE